MIDRKENKDKTEYNLDRIVQASFGYSDEQLLEQMKQAEETVSDTQIPPESEHGFEELIAKADSRGVTPYTEDKDSGEGEDRKIRRLGPIVKVGLAVAVMTSVLLMTSITAGAKRSYKYEAKTRVEMKSDMVLNSADSSLKGDELESAYKSIRDQLGINVLRFGEIPNGLEYLKMSINNDRALMYFTYNNEPVHFIQQRGREEKNIDIVSDRKDAEAVYNVWLRQDILISNSEVDSGQKEYSTSIVTNSAYYYISGIMEKKQFKALVEALYFLE